MSFLCNVLIKIHVLTICQDNFGVWSICLIFGGQHIVVVNLQRLHCNIYCFLCSVKHVIHVIHIENFSMQLSAWIPHKWVTLCLILVVLIFVKFMFSVIWFCHMFYKLLFSVVPFLFVLLIWFFMHVFPATHPCPCFMDCFFLIFVQFPLLYYWEERLNQTFSHFHGMWPWYVPWYKFWIKILFFTP